MVCVPSCSARDRPQPALGTAGSGPSAVLSAPGSSSPLISEAGAVGPPPPGAVAGAIGRPVACWPSAGDGAGAAPPAGAALGVGVFANSGGMLVALGSIAGDSDEGGSAVVAVAESLLLEQAVAARASTAPT